jgi:hypothetical protein
MLEEQRRRESEIVDNFHYLSVYEWQNQLLELLIQFAKDQAPTNDNDDFWGWTSEFIEHIVAFCVGLKSRHRL